MKITTLQKTISECVGETEWKNKFESSRQIILKNFPFSIFLEGSTDEFSLAIDWCLSNIGKRNNILDQDNNINFRKLENSSSDGKWDELWYDKLDYDYGISEFFFNSEKSLNDFKSNILSIKK